MTMRSALFLFATLAAAAAAQEPAPVSAVQADTLMQAGAAAEQHGDWKAAIEDFRKVIQLEPGSAEAHSGLGAALAGSGQLDAAVAEDQRALELAPKDLRTRMNLASAYFKQGDLSRARAELESIHTDHPDDLRAAIMLGYVYLRMKRFVGAEELLAPLEPTNASNTALEYILADAMIETGNQEQGIPKMERVAEATHSADAWMIAAAAHFRRTEGRAALADAEQALKIDPTLPGVYTLVGQARYAIGDKTGAETALREALRLNPQDFYANFYLGDLCTNRKDYAEAEPFLKLALDLEPGVPLARFDLAKIYAATGREAQAVPILEDIVKGKPDWIDAHWELANIYFRMNRIADAQRERSIVQKLRAGQAGK